MVSKTVALPNIRKMFIPDPGYIICDSDLAQADAQVVAWEADDNVLKEIFRDPDQDLHDQNAITIFGKLTDYYRKLAKAGVHATNYGASAFTLSRALGISLYEAKRFIDTWFTAHPGIYDWHQRVELELQTSRTVYNKFRYRKVFFSRIDKVLPEALAWIPQSTVATIINKGLQNIDEQLYPDVQNLIQVHDSLVYQLKKFEFYDLRPKIRECLTIEVPYEDPLVIPVDLAVSGKSWGDVEKIGWEGDVPMRLMEAA